MNLKISILRRIKIDLMFIFIWYITLIKNLKKIWDVSNIESCV